MSSSPCCETLREAVGLAGHEGFTCLRQRADAAQRGGGVHADWRYRVRAHTGLREAYLSGDDEELSEAAMREAARASLRCWPQKRTGPGQSDGQDRPVRAAIPRAGWWWPPMSTR